MLIEKPDNARFLPEGELTLEFNGEELPLVVHDHYVVEAACAIIERGIVHNANTKAEVVAYAINELHWGLGERRYRVVASYTNRDDD